MEIALVGLQFAGKSAVFDLLAATEGSALPQHPGQRRLTLRLPDPRLDALAGVLKPKKKTPATVSVLDPAPRGVDEGRGAGAGDPFAHARTADGLVLVLRAFDAPEVPHPAESIDSLRDMEVLRSDLILADLVVLDGRLEKIERMLKVGKRPESPLEEPLLERCKAALETERPLGDIDLSDEDRKMLSGFGLLTTKPLLAVLNVGEKAPGCAPEVKDRLALLAEFQNRFPGTMAMAVCAPLELELAGMEPGEARDFMDVEGIERLGGGAILEALADLCGRVTFFTVIKGEVRAWTVPRGSTAVQAAGAVHTDMEKGFIKAETINWKGLVECGSAGAAREKGLLRLEGRAYLVQDGDVMTIRFSP